MVCLGRSSSLNSLNSNRPNPHPICLGIHLLQLRVEVFLVSHNRTNSNSKLVVVSGVSLCPLILILTFGSIWQYTDAAFRWSVCHHSQYWYQLVWKHSTKSGTTACTNGSVWCCQTYDGYWLVWWWYLWANRHHYRNWDATNEYLWSTAWANCNEPAIRWNQHVWYLDIRPAGCAYY